MANLSQVIQLAETLEPCEQLRLVAHISDRLSQACTAPGPVSKAEREKRRRETREILRDMDRLTSSGPTINSAESIRRMRDERHQQLWSNK